MDEVTRGRSLGLSRVGAAAASAVVVVIVIGSLNVVEIIVDPVSTSPPKAPINRHRTLRHPPTNMSPAPKPERTIAAQSEPRA